MAKANKTWLNNTKIQARMGFFDSENDRITMSIPSVDKRRVGKKLDGSLLAEN